MADGERLPLATKELGSCEIYPQYLKHNTNGWCSSYFLCDLKRTNCEKQTSGRFVVVCGDGEYIIYTALGLRNKSFGTALEFVWATDKGA